MVVSSIPPRRGGRGPEWEDLAELTWATQRAYCAKHNYAFHGDISDVWDNVASPWHHTPPPIAYAPIRHFQKIRLMLHYMTPEKCRQNYSHVVWLDADALVTNYDVPITKWTNTLGATSDDGPDDVREGDLVLPFDVNGLHPTVIIARASTQMRGMFWAMTEAGQRLYQLHDWSENLALRFFLASPPYQQAIHWHSAQTLCAMPPNIHPMPPDVRAQYTWTPESWTLHLSALSLEKRIAIAREYIERLGLL